MAYNAPPDDLLPFPKFGVSRKDREPLVQFMVEALERSGCRVIRHSPPNRAPFQISFETPDGGKQGIVAYAFLANQEKIKNRPPDENRFQLKYGKKTGEEHELWQDPFGVYTTLLLGINLEKGFFVGYDPVLHSPTKFFISLEFKEKFAEEILRDSWASTERGRQNAEEPVEVIVGGTPESFLRYVRFEREALGEDQGHRELLANRTLSTAGGDISLATVPSPYVHQLCEEFEMNAEQVLDLIADAKRLKMAVRGWVAEAHLVKTLQTIEGVSDCERIEAEGGPDVQLRFENSNLLFVECKNVLRKANREGLARLDFQRTRASKGDPCTRYYSPNDFELVAACLHALSEKWEYQFAITEDLSPHAKCPGKLSSNVLLNEGWTFDVRGILGEAASRRG